MLPRLDDGRFHGERPLTGAQLAAALTSAHGDPAGRGSSAATVSVTAFDARLVQQLGLADVAAHVQSVARAAGLNPPSHFGTEVVARQLGLRTNHPFADDALELYPWEPITRAEAAHSLSTAMDNAAGRSRTPARACRPSASRATALRPERALRVAVSQDRHAVHLGRRDRPRVVDYYGYQAHGGYDCSGFVWRVFKLAGHPRATRIGGRTAAQMAGEIRKGQRRRLDAIRPATWSSSAAPTSTPRRPKRASTTSGSRSPSTG